MDSIDELTNEIKKIAQKNRPNTTGELTNQESTFIKQSNPINRQNIHVLSSLVTPLNDSTILKRPHAPLSRSINSASTSTIPTLKDNVIKLSNNNYNSIHLKHQESQPTLSSTSPKRNKNKKKKKKGNIQQLWESLNHFSRSDLNRALNENQDDDLFNSHVHFLNIDKTKLNLDSIKRNIDDTMFMQKLDPTQTINAKIKGINQTNTLFTIPELPKGKLLRFNILSSWGDQHYIGLMGIELYDDKGNLIRLSNLEAQLWANPSDINVLPEYGDDPRTVDNLFDGVNHTCDDLHAWLAPFTKGNNHYIYIDLDTVTTISMIRIWNYNKSRIHSYRGARYIEICFDNNYIFKGEVKKALGSHSVLDAMSCCEIILFTTNENILSLIENNDDITKSYKQALMEKEMNHNSKLHENKSLLAHLYNEAVTNIDVNDNGHEFEDIPKYFTNNLTRPGTGRRNINSKEKDVNGLDITAIRPSTASVARMQKPVSTRIIELCIISNWSDSKYCGITGLDGVDDNLQSFNLPEPHVYVASLLNENTSIQYLHDMSIENMDDTIKLINKVNITTDSSNMWRFNVKHINKGNQVVVLRFDLSVTRLIKGLRIWNYNAGHNEGSCCGVKSVIIFVDGEVHSRLIIRKAPGETNFDFNQFLPLTLSENFNNFSNGSEKVVEHKNFGFDEESGIHFYDDTNKTRNTDNFLISDLVMQQYETPLYPTGSMIKFVIHTTHGDPYYVGLNGIVLYDRNGIPIKVEPDQLHSTPYRDINDIVSNKKTDEERDTRILTNLISLPNDTFLDRHIWLTPLSTVNNPNTIFILFDHPITIGYIHIWNYSKTPNRGVNDFEILVDDVLSIRGSLCKSPLIDDFKSNNLITSSINWGNLGDDLDLSQAILFTNDKNIIEKERYRIPMYEESIEFIDDGKTASFIDNDDNNNNIIRPMTSSSRRNNFL